jgi:hypothetical protein
VLWVPNVLPVLPVLIEVTSIASPVFSSMNSFGGVSDQEKTEEIRMKVFFSV